MNNQLRWVLLFGATLLARGAKQTEKRGLVPFHLQDRDGSCLQLDGYFGACTTESLWLYAPSNNDGHAFISMMKPKGDYAATCLTRASPKGKTSAITAGACKTAGAKNWQLVLDKQSGMYFLASNDKQGCVVRTAHSTEARKRQEAARKKGKRDVYDPRFLFNGASIQSCKEGGSLLQIVETNLHDVGFWLKASDGSCFDGKIFRSCDQTNAAIVWGWGLRTAKSGDVVKFLYRWHDSKTCLVKDGTATNVGSCDSGSAVWGLEKGELSHDNGKLCLVRGLNNEAHLLKCKDSHEHVEMALTGLRSNAMTTR